MPDLTWSTQKTNRALQMSLPGCSSPDVHMPLIIHHNRRLDQSHEQLGNWNRRRITASKMTWDFKSYYLRNRSNFKSLSNPRKQKKEMWFLNISKGAQKTIACRPIKLVPKETGAPHHNDKCRVDWSMTRSHLRNEQVPLFHFTERLGTNSAPDPCSFLHMASLPQLSCTDEQP